MSGKVDVGEEVGLGVPKMPIRIPAQRRGLRTLHGSMPTEVQTGISSSHTYGWLHSYGNSATYSGTTTYTPTYGVVGSRQHTGTYINFTRYISLDALDLKIYRGSKQEKQIWKTGIFSTGHSGDLRRVFPVMIAAAAQYIGENTGKKIEVRLSEDDARVKAIKALP